MKTITLKIDGMHCEGCAARLITLLEKEPGVRDAGMSFLTGKGRITYNSHAVEEQRVIEVINRAGFEAESA